MMYDGVGSGPGGSIACRPSSSSGSARSAHNCPQRQIICIYIVCCLLLLCPLLVLNRLPALFLWAVRVRLPFIIIYSIIVFCWSQSDGDLIFDFRNGAGKYQQQAVVFLSSLTFLSGHDMTWHDMVHRIIRARLLVSLFPCLLRFYLT